MTTEILADAEAVAKRAAMYIAEQAQIAVSARGRFIFAVSGGRTPWVMMRQLTREDVPWADTDIVQVDERIAPSGHADRNLTSLVDCLRDAPFRQEQIHAMPVEDQNLDAAADRYGRLLQTIAGSPPVLDLIHLGLGPDGHTASLVPGDPVLDVADRAVALTNVYQGRRRMTLTFPVLNRARRILWVVTGSDKAKALAQLRHGDTTIPAGRIQQDRAQLIADSAAAEWA